MEVRKCHKYYILFVTQGALMGTSDYAKLIAERILDATDGTLFIGSDFADLAPDDAIRKTLSRMVASGRLERPVRGIFRKPKYSEFLGEPTVASAQDIAATIARKYNWSIAPSPDTALNMLGLDTQVPTTFAYVSDGPYKEYEYGPFEISYKHTSNRSITSLSPETALLIQALKALGKDGVSDSVYKAIATKLDESQLEVATAESKVAPVWIREAIKQIATLKEAGNA